MIFPESPSGRHCVWLWEIVERGGSELAEDDLNDHFTAFARSFPSFRNAEALKVYAQHSYLAGAELAKVTEERPDCLVMSITTSSGLALEACVVCDPEDGRIVAVGPRLPGGGSATAVTVAGLRAAHYVVDGGMILADTLAEALSGEVGRGPIAAARASPNTPAPRWNHAARSRWAEDTLEEQNRAGVDQYVVLGAGLDSFAYRQRERPMSVQVFEVDLPLSQSWKRTRLADIGVAEPTSVTYVSVDFETEQFDDELVAAGFDPDRPSVIAWLGVTYYLTRVAIDDTLARIARWAPGTKIIFDYHVPEHLFDSFGAAFDGNTRRSILRTLATIGEPMITLFTAHEIETVLHSRGFHSVEHLDHTGIREQYMRPETTTKTGPVPFFATVRATV